MSDYEVVSDSLRESQPLRRWVAIADELRRGKTLRVSYDAKDLNILRACLRTNHGYLMRQRKQEDGTTIIWAVTKERDA
jgi:hypothetical protein